MRSGNVRGLASRPETPADVGWATMTRPAGCGSCRDAARSLACPAPAAPSAAPMIASGSASGAGLPASSPEPAALIDCSTGGVSR